MFPVTLMAVLPFFINSKVSISVLASQFRTISEPKVVRFSTSRHAWNYLWELEEQRASCEFESVRARHEFRDRRRLLRDPFILEEVGTTVAVKRSKISLWAIVRIKIEETSGWFFLTGEFSLLSEGEAKIGKIVENELKIMSEPKNFSKVVYFVRKICRNELVSFYLLDIAA